MSGVKNTSSSMRVLALLRKSFQLVSHFVRLHAFAPVTFDISWRHVLALI